MPEDPMQDRSEGEGACPCFVRLRFIRVAGNIQSDVIAALGTLFAPGTIGKDIYHSALEVQVPENGECVRYVIEMEEYISDPDQGRAKGQVLEGHFGPDIFGGSEYGIRKWRNGKIDRGDDPEVAHPGRLILSRDCNVARRLLELVESIPTTNYTRAWTSNSIISWLLKKGGLDPGGVKPPVGGVVPNWQSGIDAAQ
jgi:hypothetical protein